MLLHHSPNIFFFTYIIFFSKLAHSKTGSLKGCAMKYHIGLELICIKTVKRKRGTTKGQVNFIKGKTYKVEEVYEKEYYPSVRPVFIRLINEQGELQPIGGKNKTKYFKIPRPEGVPVIPPPPPKSKEQKTAERKAKKEAEKQKKMEEVVQTKEWKKIKKLKVKNRSKRLTLIGSFPPLKGNGTE